MEHGGIKRVLTGRNGNVRAAEVRAVDKGGKTATFRRPLQKLFTIELSVRKQEMSAVPITFVEHVENEN